MEVTSCGDEGTGMTDGTVTAAEIGRIAGVSRAAVSNWRKRHDDFPKPVGGTTTSPSFSLAEVEAWLRAKRELEEVRPEEQLWQRIRAASEELNLAEVMGDVSLLLLCLHRVPSAWLNVAYREGSDFDNELAKAVRAAAYDIPNGRLSEGASSAGRAELLREVGECQYNPGPLFEFLLGRFLDANSNRMFTTPAAVAQLMVQLATSIPDRSGVIFDPACGSGSLLMAAVRQGVTHPVGQELDPDLARLAAIRLAMACDRSRVVNGNSLLAGQFERQSVNAVVCNPPFGQTEWGHDELTDDLRWEYGVPPRAESELAWVQHALWHVKPGGLVVILMPPSAAGRKSGRDIRRELLKRGVLRAVVALPAGGVPGSLGLHLWVLYRPALTESELRRRYPAATPVPPSPLQTRSDVLMVDTTGMPIGEAAERTLQAWAAYQSEGRELPDRAYVVRPIDLVDEVVDCTPAQWLSPAADADPAQRFTEARQELWRIFNQLPALMRELDGERFTSEPSAAPLPMITIGELARAKALRILTSNPIKAAETFANRGDVVVPMRLGSVRVVTAENTTLLGSNLAVLRPNPAVLDPDFLAAFLQAARIEQSSSKPRLDIRAIQIPRIPIAEQRRLGATLRGVAELHKTFTRGAELGEELGGHLVAGLANGTIHLPDRSS